jgi:hypothetical protein
LRTEPFPEPLNPVMSTNCFERFFVEAFFFIKQSVARGPLSVALCQPQGNYELGSENYEEDSEGGQWSHLDEAWPCHRRGTGSLPRFIGVPPVKGHGQDGRATANNTTSRRGHT